MGRCQHTSSYRKHRLSFCSKRLTDTSLFTVGVSPKSVLSSESSGDRTLLEGVHDGVRGSCRWESGISKASSLYRRTSLDSRKNCSNTIHIPVDWRTQMELETHSQHTPVARIRTSQNLSEEEELSSLVQSARTLAVIRILQTPYLSRSTGRGSLGRSRTRGIGKGGIFGTRRSDGTLLDFCWGGRGLSESEERRSVE